MSEASSQVYLVGITGASGAIYGIRLIEALLADSSRSVHAMVSPAGMRVLTGELDPVASGAGEKRTLESYLNLTADQKARLFLHGNQDIGACPASGTFRTRGMIIAPCSMNTLAAVANGFSDNLVSRSASVTLKEGRPLILVPRETPLTLMDLRNMTSVAEAGGVILPASPGLYHRPTTVEGMTGYVVQKIMDRLGLETSDAIRWGETHKG